jgi:hypothetical protein
MLSTTWGIPVQDFAGIPDSYVKGVIERLREKLFNPTVGVKEEYVLKKIYQDFDIQRVSFFPLTKFNRHMIILGALIFRN